MSLGSVAAGWMLRGCSADSWKSRRSKRRSGRRVEGGGCRVEGDKRVAFNPQGAPVGC